jgi:AcrR family transcriptional regulator
MAMVTRPASPRRRLTPGDWTGAALAAIADGGLAAVAIEPLAARLGATKGSFYWHFASREDLVTAALARWEQETTTEIASRARVAAGDPAGQVRTLITETARLARTDRVGLALLAGAARPEVGQVLDRVTRRRLEILGAFFAGLGFAPSAARHRALLAYSVYLGHAQLSHTTPQLLPQPDAERQAYLEAAIALLGSAPGND